MVAELTAERDVLAKQYAAMVRGLRSIEYHMDDALGDLEKAGCEVSRVLNIYRHSVRAERQRDWVDYQASTIVCTGGPK